MRRNKRCQICYNYIKKTEVKENLFYCSKCDEFHRKEDYLLWMPKDIDEIVLNINNMDGEFIKPFVEKNRPLRMGFILTGTFSTVLRELTYHETKLILFNIYDKLSKKE